MNLPVALCVLPFVASSLLAQEPKPAPPATAPVAAPAAAPAAAAAPKVLQLGERLDGEMTLRDIDGKVQKAHDLMGTLTVVNFYSITCPIQAAWDGRLAAIQKAYEAKGVTFLHIDSNVSEIGAEPQKAEGAAKPYANVREHLQEKELPFRVLVDHGNVVADVFDARTTPHVYVFGKDGKLVYKGLVDDDQGDKKPDQRNDYLRSTLDKLLAGEKVEPFATKELGCSIKRVKKADAGGGKGEGRRGEGRKGGAKSGGD